MASGTLSAAAAACPSRRCFYRVHILSSHRFDVVISDIRMPKLDGWGLFEHVRRSTPDTDVILMTAYATGPDAMRAFMRGASEYLRKPLDAEELTSHLQQISERRTQRTQWRQKYR